MTFVIKQENSRNEITRNASHGQPAQQGIVILLGFAAETKQRIDRRSSIYRALKNASLCFQGQLTSRQNSTSGTIQAVGNAARDWPHCAHAEPHNKTRKRPRYIFHHYSYGFPAHSPSLPRDQIRSRLNQHHLFNSSMCSCPKSRWP